MKRICLIVLMLFTLCTSLAVADGMHFEDVFNNARTVADKVKFIEAADPVTYDDGLIVTFTSPVVALLDSNFNATYYCFTGDDGFSCAPTLNGISCTFQNTSDKVLIIKWADSAISSGSFSGIPFLSGMKYTDAGNPSATPDTLIAPGQTISKDVYISRVKFKNNWWIIGEPIPKQGGIKCILSIKVVDGNGNYQYFSPQTPLIGVTD